MRRPSSSPSRAWPLVLGTTGPLEIAMIPIPTHHQGDLFRNTNDDLSRSRRIACIGENGGPYDTGQLARAYFAAAHQLLLWDVPSEQIA